MYAIVVYNHQTKINEERLEFSTKREANKFCNNNCEKRGYDFFSKNNRSLEYQKQY